MFLKKIKYKLNQLLGLPSIIKNLILDLPLGSEIKVRLNGVEATLPVEVLKNYINCCHCGDDKLLDFFVEPHITNYLVGKLASGDVVLDIGAAFGTVSLPLSKAIGSQGTIYAFEPALNTQKILKKVINLNHLENVKIINKAVSDINGVEDFVEYSPENTFDWAPDTSTLDISSVDENLIYEKYQVNLITIDNFVETNQIQPKAMKIDIEGFELYALEGAKKTLESYQPYLCIDIHNDVKTLQSSLEPVKLFLQNLGYQCEYRYHTLFAQAKN